MPRGWPQWGDGYGNIWGHIEDVEQLNLIDQWPAASADVGYRVSVFTREYMTGSSDLPGMSEPRPFRSPSPTFGTLTYHGASHSGTPATGNNDTNQTERISLRARIANLFRKKKKTQTSNDDLEAGAADTDDHAEDNDNDRPSRLSRFGHWVLSHIPILFRLP